MHSNMAEDANSNTLCIGRVIPTPMTSGLITRTYTPQTHWQTSTSQTPLQLDDLQYKETTKILQMSLIPTSLWLFTTLKNHLQSTVLFALTIPIYSSPFICHITARQCPTCPLPSSSLPAHLPLPTVLATPLMSSLLPLLIAQPVKKWLSPMSK